MIQDIGPLCQKTGFVLEKQTSNSRVVLQAITVDQRAKDLKNLDLDLNKLPFERALGLQWCVETDSFGFKMVMKQRPFTRRGMLSVSSSFYYNSLGFLAPVTLLAKMTQQELCRRGCGQDDELPQDILIQWKGLGSADCIQSASSQWILERSSQLNYTILPMPVKVDTAL